MISRTSLASRLDPPFTGEAVHGLPPEPSRPPVRSLDAASHRPPDVVTLKPIHRTSVSRALPPATVPRSRADTRKRG